MDVLEQLGLKKRLKKLKACPRSPREVGEGGDGKELVVKGVPAEAKSFVLRGVPSLWGNPVLVVASDKKEADKLAKELRFFLKNGVLIFPEFGKDDTEEVKIQKQGILQKILLALEKNKPKIIILTIEDLEVTLIDPTNFKNQKLELALKQNFDLEELVKFFIENGYLLQNRIDVTGTFARRGGMIDLYLPNYRWPLRLEFLQDQLESILAVDLVTGEIKKKLSRIEIRSLNLISLGGKTTISSYCDPQKTLLIYQQSESVPRYLLSAISYHFVLDNFPSEDSQNIIDLGFKSVPSYWGQLEMLRDDLITKQKAGWEIRIVTKHRDSLVSILKGKTVFEIDSDKVETVKVDDRRIFPIVVKEAKETLPSFQNPASRFIYLTDQVIFKRLLKPRKIRHRRIDKDFILSLKPDDFVVHVDHGVGKFKKIVKRIVDGIEREYFLVRYTEGDKLFVPVDQADRLNRYVGVENPTLNRLSGIAWGQAKLRVKRKTREIARKLLELYAKRELSRGHAFGKDNHLQEELEKSFPHQETKDQLRTLEEVKNDMENEYIMDRLICGDVGFGKTEVALRAAFKAVMDKKQVAFLAPTTILVEQHLETFKERLKKFPVRVESLSRFKTRSEQRKILEDLKNGEIDIIIGTHRLLQKDVEFKNLGLVIIDEEQRFGVEHKEYFKEIRNKVDILALSATPIPRTLNLALGGIRSISTITTPPPGRLPVETQVKRYDEELIRDAIRRELKRSGQVYFLHNRVQTIESIAHQIRELVPEAKVVVAHGQLESRKLEKIMDDFYQGEYNVLVCSSIIENGLDIPTVNTLIVDEAVNFGLAQLYQLRGRIGRSHKKAYAYFLYQAKYLKGLARKRLEALLEAEKLGSGFEIAMRDLEIRGAGNVLGTEQHGQITAVGLGLYSRLLNQAVEELRLGKKIDELETVVDLPVAALIPEGFVRDEKERIELYQKIAGFINRQELFNYHDELKREHKILPEQVENLFRITEIKLLAHEAGIIEVKTRTIKDINGKDVTKILLVFKHTPDPKIISKLLEKQKHWRLYYNQLKIEKEDLGENWLSALREDLEVLGG